jgi:uncharacterized membrane-anchored protein YhcB (DUF1043 family)
MALYVPAGRRRRNLAIALAATAVVAVVVGFLIGRVTAPTVDDRVSEVQADARGVVGELAATPNEYRQQQSGSSEFAQGGGVADALANTRRSLDAAMDDAPWLGPSLRKEATDALDTVVAAEKASVPPDEYSATITRASSRIEQVFGIDR